MESKNVKKAIIMRILYTMEIYIFPEKFIVFNKGFLEKIVDGRVIPAYHMVFLALLTNLLIC